MKKIAIGNDHAGTQLKNQLKIFLEEYGYQLINFGTDSDDNPTTGGVMITASHLPFNRNGLKFFTKEGGLDKKDITEILRIAEENEFPENGSQSEVSKLNLIDEYAGFLVEYIRNGANIQANFKMPLQGLKIIVDAGNGAGGFFASKVLNQLGADTKGSQFLEPDGKEQTLA